MKNIKKNTSEVISPDEQQKKFEEVLGKLVVPHCLDSPYNLSSVEAIKKWMLSYINKFNSLVQSYYTAYDNCLINSYDEAAFKHLQDIHQDLKLIDKEKEDFFQVVRQNKINPLEQQIKQLKQQNSNSTIQD